MRIKCLAIMLLVVFCLIIAGCKAPPPPFVDNQNRGGSPDEAKSLLFVCPSLKVSKGMILDKTMEADSFVIRGMKCKVELSKKETVYMNVFGKKAREGKDVLFCGTMFQVKKDPASYKTTYQITFTYPGFKDVVFMNIPITAGRIEVPRVVFRSAK